MPYARNSDLPKAVRDVLPAEAQSIFRNVVNGQLARGLSEERAFRSAWGELKNQGWAKGKNGMWHKTEKTAHFDTCDACRHPIICGRVKHCIDKDEKKSAKTFRIALLSRVVKVDEDKRLVFGWFSVIERGGEAEVDDQGDVIREEELEKTAYRFVLNARVAGEMHERRGVGDLVESIMFTKEKQAALGIDLGMVGWWGGFYISDDEVWKSIKSGKYPMFSIGGTARRD